MSGSNSGGWLRVTLLSLLGTIAVLTTIVAYCLANPATLKPLASYLTETFTGRTLVIEGEVELEISLRPRVVARKVLYGNADWSTNPHMWTADYLMVQLDLMALFDNHVDILDLDTRAAVVYLEDPVDGEPNWRLFRASDPTNGEPITEGGDWSFMIQGLKVEDSVVFASIGELEPISLEIPELIETSDADGNLLLEGHGTLNELPWHLSGTVGTFEELLIAGAISLDLDMTVDDTRITASGTIGELASLSDLDLSGSLYGPNASVFGEILQMEESFKNDIALTGSIRPDSSGHAMDISGHVSDFEVKVTGTVLDLNNLEGWDADFDVKGPDAGVFGKALQIRGLPEGPFEIVGRIHLHGGDLDLTDVKITNEEVNLTLNADFQEFPRREGAFGNVRLTGPDLGLFRELLRIPTLPTVPFELALTLDADGSQVQSDLTAGTHTLNINGTVGEFPTFNGTRLTTSIGGEDVSEILRLARIEEALSGPYRAAALVAIEAGGLEATDISFESGPFQLTGSGVLPDFATLKEFTVSGDLNVRDLAEAGSHFSIEDLPPEPLRLRAEVRSSKIGFELIESTIDFQTARALVTGDLGTLSGPTGLDIQLSVQGSDLEEVFDDALPGDQIPFTLTSRIRGHEGAIELINLELAGEGGSFNVDGTITLVDRFTGSRLSISGRGGDLSGLIPTFPNYIPPRQPWEIDFDVGAPDAAHLEIEQSSFRVGSIQIAASGLLDIADQTSTDLFVEASGDSFSDLGQIGEVAWPELPFSITAKLDGSKDILGVTRLELFWGDSDLTATGSVSLVDKPVIVLAGNSSTMNLLDLEKALFGEPEDLDPDNDATRVFPDTPIPVDDLMAYDADIDIQVTKFRGMNASLDDVDLALKLKDGVLELERAAYRDNTGSFDASALLRAQGEQVYIELQLTGEEADLGLFTSTKQAPETIPRYSMDISISGVGATVAELAGNLNGRVLISSDGGRIDNAALEAFTGDFLTNVLEVLNPFVSNEPFTPMECMVVNAAIDDGMVRLEPGYVMRTNRVNMFVYGNVDLKKEQLDLSLATQARRGIGISAASITNPYFKIGGTLASPALQLDPASAAVAASVATATAGLSIVIKGLWDRLMGTQNPCPQFLKYKPKKSKEAAVTPDG